MNISTVKKIFAAGAVLVFSAVLLTGCGGNSASSGDKKFLNIGTGGTAGTYYPIGGAIAEVLNIMLVLADIYVYRRGENG